MTEPLQRQVIDTGQNIVIILPWRLRRLSGRQLIESCKKDTDCDGETKVAGPTALALAIAKAHRWQQLLDAGLYESISELARAQRKAYGAKANVEDSSYVTRVLKLTLLAPDIVTAILDSKEPSGLSLEKMRVIPELWEEQRRKFGFIQ